MSRCFSRKWFLPAVLAAALIPASGAFMGQAEARPRHGTAVVVLPAGHRPVVVRQVTYYYHDGAYYQRAPRGYVVVAAPHGAVVPVIPARHRIVVLRGATYYEDDGVYYRRVLVAGQPQYEVVQYPVQPEVRPPAPAQPPVLGAPYCREALIPIFVAGKEERAVATACREPDGTWRLRP